MSLPAPDPRPPLPTGFADKLAAIVGPKGVITDPADMLPYTEERRGNYQGATPVVLRPAATEEVAQIVSLCAHENVAIVPQGGNTGLTGASVTNGEILLNLGRLNKIRALDPQNFTMTVEAGCILAEAQRIAAEQDRLFPLSLGAEGSCQIGGNLSTNAGGTAVLRYGNIRELTLGLEVVLADGRIWNGLRGLRKDNTGYDLKHLFIGAEGSLGIITAAVLKLFPLPHERHTAFVALANVEAALELLALARQASADAVTACEYMPRIGIDFALRHNDTTRDPLAQPHDHYLLLELSASRPDSGMAEALETTLSQAFDKGLIADAAIANSDSQRQHLWLLREALVHGQASEGVSIKNDVAVPLSKIPQFLRRADQAVSLACPGVRPVAFGHLGDGNIHYNLSQPLGADGAAFHDRWRELTSLVSEIAMDLGGTFSAEHGIGLLKREALHHFKAPVEIDMMQRLKQALDPQGIMNPGKLL